MQHQLHIECKENSQAVALLDRAQKSDGLAVVGTRYPTRSTLRWLEKELLLLKGTSVILVSGLAIGVDSLAHELAIECGLPTLAFLACGLDQTYPPENERLRRKIIEAGGAVISEYSWGVPALKHHFLKRNRLIAWYSKAVLIAESPARSGALNTAKWAKEYERDLYVIPAFPEDQRYAGNTLLLSSPGVLPFTGIQSLGNTWLEFGSLKKEQLGLFDQPTEELRPACEFILKHYPDMPPPELIEAEFVRAGLDSTLLYPAWNYLSLKSRTS